MADKKYRMRLSLSDGLFWFLDFISPQGPKGEKGDDGVSPVVAVEEIEGGHKVTVTDASGARAFIVLDGDDGVGVVAIEQTSTSDEDGGSNEITATLSDGTKSTFTVKNGRKGSKGDAGNGIKAAALNSDYTLTLTFDDGTIYTTPSIRGAKGETGAPGVHIGNEAPTNGEKVWIDPTEEAEEGIQMDVVAKVGQLLAVAEVDENGKPTKLVAVDLPKAETPNFAANEGEKGYIEGRTHYVDEKGVIHKLPNMFIDADWMATSKEVPSTVEIIPEQKISSGMWKNIDSNMLPGFVYDVHINGVVYPCEARSYYNGAVLGNNTDFTLNNYPFCIMWAGGSATSGMFFGNDTLSYPLLLKVTDHAYTEYNKLPVEFLSDEAALKTDVDKAIEEQDTETKKYIEQYVKPIITSVAANSNAIEKKITAPTAAAVGQTIIVEEVDESGKPTKWKAADYQKKICGDELSYIVPETTVNYENGDTGELTIDTLLVEGKQYVVTWEGVDYTCVCFTVSDDGTIVYAIGNRILIDGETDTGEPFVFMTAIMDGAKSVAGIPVDESVTSFTFSVKGEVAIPIPAPYLTNALPYYIEIVGSGATDNPYVCNDTVANVRAAYDGGRQLFVRNAMAGDGIWAKIHIPLVSVAEGNGVRVYSFFAQGASTASLYRFALTEQEDGTFAMAT